MKCFLLYFLSKLSTGKKLFKQLRKNQHSKKLTGAEFSASFLSPLDSVPLTGLAHPGHVLLPFLVPRVRSGDFPHVARDDGCQGQ